MPSSELSKAEAARRRRAAELLGDADTSTDDSDEGWGEQAAPTSDEEYLKDVPPHHG